MKNNVIYLFVTDMTMYLFISQVIIRQKKKIQNY